jgi:hypothetical protein
LHFKEPIMAYWHQDWACTPEIQDEFCTEARASLYELASALGLAKGAYRVQYSSGGARACGALTLHHGAIQVRIGHTATGGWEIRIRPGRAASTDALDHFEPLYLLNDIEAFAFRVRRMMAAHSANARHP